MSLLGALPLISSGLTRAEATTFYHIIQKNEARTGVDWLATMDAMPIPSTVWGLLVSMNAIIPAGPTTKIYWSVTGEPYEEYAVGTPNNEGAEARLCRWMWQTFRKKVSICDDLVASRLYWRIKPEIDVFDQNSDWIVPTGLTTQPLPKMIARCYSRYLISSKPILISSDDCGERELLRLAEAERWPNNSSELKVTQLKG